jgi:TolB protein
VYLVAGEVIAVPGGFQVDLKIHDVVYGTVKQATSVPVPLVSSPNFRLAIHAAADDVVRTVTGQPGMAATRVAFVRQNGRGNYDLLVVDSDGENLRRIAGSGTQIYSPTWSPDGRRLAYTMRETEGWRLVERDMETGTTRTIHSGSGLIMTPAYSPDGAKIAFALYIPGGAEIHEYDVSRGCCLRKLTDSSGDNMYPSYSADGRQLAFMSTRTGKHHVYVMAADGGTATILSRFGEGVEYNAPDWSPTGSGIAFHGTSRGTFQLMLGDASRPGGQLQQLTSRGWNEDPSWAPDGRHLVFTQGLGRGEAELYVIDIVTGSVRQLAPGNNLRLADWSPSLARLATGGQ